MRRTFSIAVAAILVFAGMLLLTGCFFVPTFNVTAHGTNVAAKVGDAKSNRPVRVGIATREQIEAMFGRAPYRDESRRRIGYAWSAREGVWIYPLCFGGVEQIGDRGIELDFDNHDVLERFLIYKTNAPSSLFGANIGATDPVYPRRPPFDAELHPNADESSPYHLRSTTCPTAPTSSTN